MIRRETESIVRTELDDDFFRRAYNDYQRFMKEVRLATTPRHQEILAAQSVHGHAVEGDKEFIIKKGNDIIPVRYENATISDIYQAIIKFMPDYASSVKAVQKERMASINEVKGWIQENMNHVLFNKSFSHYSPTRLVDRAGNPLMGIEMLRHYPVEDPLKVLIGIYLVSYMDSEFWREQTEDYFNEYIDINLDMHRGICTAGNLEKIKELGLTISKLSRLAGNKSFSLEYLKQNDAVLDFLEHLHKKDRKKGVSSDRFCPVYVELNKGVGISDDAAMIYLGLMYGIAAALGGVVIDAVDTLDKCLPHIKENGEDESIGNMIVDMFGGKDKLQSELFIHDQDIINLIFAAAIDPVNHSKWPSCSQRRFLQYQNQNNYALMNHMTYINHVRFGSPYPPNIKLSIKEIPSNSFYPLFEDRIRLMLQEHRHPILGRKHFLEKDILDPKIVEYLMR